MEVLETLIGQYLSCNGAAFVCPQFEVAHDSATNTGGASPDFVVLDFRNRDLVVVEVSGAASVDGLLGKVAERRTRWFEPVRRKLLNEGAIDERWTLRFLGFIRRDAVKGARQRFSDADVAFMAIEDAAFGWSYWDDRQQGLPGRAGEVSGGHSAGR